MPFFQLRIKINLFLRPLTLSKCVCRPAVCCSELHPLAMATAKHAELAASRPLFSLCPNVMSVREVFINSSVLPAANTVCSNNRTNFTGHLISSRFRETHTFTISPEHKLRPPAGSVPPVLPQSLCCSLSVSAASHSRAENAGERVIIILYKAACASSLCAVQVQALVSWCSVSVYGNEKVTLVA